MACVITVKHIAGNGNTLVGWDHDALPKLIGHKCDGCCTMTTANGQLVVFIKSSVNKAGVLKKQGLIRTPMLGVTFRPAE